ncbi:MAG: N-6 DNA methylase [Lachnospiraceae bacterium]|nr:N-6 DNA methylase [Lachnospiraceae bacterium]
MNRNRLNQLVDKYRKYQTYYHDNKNAYNETECRDEYISPLLECLGWDVQNARGTLPQYKEVVVEKFSNSAERPDYTLTLNGVSKIFVEAKKPSVNILIETEPAMQARRYGWNAKHAVSVLTNFEYLLIYDTTNQPQESDDARTSLYRKYYFEEYVEKVQEIGELISRESVYSGCFDQLVEQSFARSGRHSTEIDETFLKQMNAWRLQLGVELYAKYKDLRVLNDIVQDFINQIIFIRICEDRKLPLYKRLYEMITDKAQLQKALTDTFQEADKRYNSGLFKNKYLNEYSIFDLNSDSIYDMIDSLYYPKTPYLFTIIKPDILGKIYESFLTERLTVSEGMVCLAKKSEYQYKSVVSTPVEIVKYMVKNTLEPICINRSPEALRQLKIIDIACGSGVFLQEAYQYLIDYSVRWYEEHDPAYLLELDNGRKKLPLEDKKRLLLDCIFGVDIDLHAVEVSKFSLLLKLIEDETLPSVKGANPILPDLSANLQTGNALIERADLNDVAVSVEELIDMAPFDWSDINHGEKFDVVLGNPPYVKTEDMHLLSGDTEFALYKNKYQSAYKQYDKYFLFTEKAMSLLKDNGVLCYIIPNKFYKIAAGQELRKLLCQNVYSIDDFGDAQLFPDKTIYSAIVTAGKQKCTDLRYSHINTAADLWIGKNVESIVLKNEDLSKEPWCLSSDIGFMRMLNNIQKKSVPLSEVAEVLNGIQTSAERPERFSDKKEVYWFSNACIESEDDSFLYINRYDHQYRIEKSILKPYFKPTKAAEKGMDTYSLLSTDKRIIFPYDAEGKLYDIQLMRANYPGTFAYLSDCYDRLVPRCLNHGIGRDVPDATPDTWYKYGRTQALTAFVNTPKLIVRVLSKEPMYAYDDQDMLIASGGTAGYCAVKQSAKSCYALEYIQAWLAHPYTERIFQIQGSDFENGFTARGTFLLKKLPFVLLDWADAKQKELYEEVVADARRIYKLNHEIRLRPDKTSRTILEKEKQKLVREIQALITKVYEQDF